MSEQTRPLAPVRGAFRQFRPVTQRWGDVDVFGHVNNAVFAGWFDTAAVAALHEVGALSARAPRFATLVAETRTTFFAEVLFTDRIETGLAVERLGRRSVTWTIATFRVEEEQAAAACRFVHVFADPATRRPVEIPDDVRERLCRFRVGNASTEATTT